MTDFLLGKNNNVYTLSAKVPKVMTLKEMMTLGVSDVG